MKFIKLVSFLLIFLVFNSITSAYTFESYVNTVELEEKDSSHVIEGLFLIGEKINQVNLTLIPRINNLQVFIDDNRKECDLEEKVGFSLLRCSFPEGIVGKHFLKITFSSNYPILKVGNKVLFKSEYNPIAETEKFTYIVKLPIGYTIPEEEGKDIPFFINPKPDNIYSDGRRIILFWEEKNLNEKFEVSVFIKRLAQPVTKVVLLSILILAIFSLVSFYLIKKRKKEAQETRMPVLLEKERKIVEALQKAKNHELWQKQLQIETGLSKARLSRTLRDLEARGIIKKEPVGNTNKILLTREEERENPESEHKEETKPESMQED